jgi:hypothetical protein
MDSIGALECTAAVQAVLHCAACRAAAADIELGGYKVPKGMLLFLCMGGMYFVDFTALHCTALCCLQGCCCRH